MVDNIHMRYVLVNLLILAFLANTDFVPTKNFPLSGLVPHTTAGAPSHFTDTLIASELDPFNVSSNPLKYSSTALPPS